MCFGLKLLGRIHGSALYTFLLSRLPALRPRASKVRQKTHQSTATIRYGDPGVAASVVSEWHHTYYCGRRIIVDFARRG